ncbi:MAG: O-methyltransferase family [Geobacteraceae bacterium]|nr:MAG: O-methyltransferase family [Geobacteraceae bacterium]
MIPITDSRIESYLMHMIPEDDPHLAAMEEKAEESGLPIVGRLVGRFLYLLTRLRQPALVVELGSGFGYSAYWFARALSVRGKVVLTDYSEKNVAYARQVFTESGFSGRGEFRVGDALQIGREYNDIDLLFIDIDKYQYPEAIRVMWPRLAPNALVIADNALWHGKVAEEGTQDRETEGIRQFNEFMFSHDDFFSSIIPLRDGVLLAYKFN